MKIRTSLAAAVLAVGLASPALAQNKPYVEMNYGFSSVSDSRDYQHGFTLRGGNDFGPIRAEVAMNHNFMSQNAGGGNGNLNTTTLSGHLYLEKTFGKTTPFVGLGVGNMWADGTGTARNSSIVGIVSTGLAYALTEKVSLVGRYDYTMSADPLVINGGNPDRLKSHSFMAGARLSF